MTGPGHQTESGGAWTIRFIMPSSMVAGPATETFGRRRAPSGPRAARRAAIRSAAGWSDALFDEKNAELLAWMQKKVWSRRVRRRSPITTTPSPRLPAPQRGSFMT